MASPTSPGRKGKTAFASKENTTTQFLSPTPGAGPQFGQLGRPQDINHAMTQKNLQSTGGTHANLQQLVSGFHCCEQVTSQLYDDLLRILEDQDEEISHQAGPTTFTDWFTKPQKKVRNSIRPESMSKLDFAMLQQINVNASAMQKIQMAGQLEGAKTSHWVEHPRFNTLVGFIIMLNSLIMALEVDYELDLKRVEKNADQGVGFLDYTGMSPVFFTAFEVLFTTIFVVELVVRIRVLKGAFFRDTWSIVDVFSIVPSVILLVFGNTGTPARQLQVIRMLRLLKLCRLLRLIKIFRQLHLIVSGFIEALRTVGWVVLLIGVLVFTFAVFNTQTVGLNPDMKRANLDCKPSDYNCVMFDQYRYFGSVIRTMLTLFQIFTLDGWAIVVRPVVEQGMPWMLPIFILFIFLTSYGLLNLLIGVIVENVTHMAMDQDAEQQSLFMDKQGQVLLGFIKLFISADTLKSGKVEVERLKRSFDQADEELQGVLMEAYLDGDFMDLISLCEILTTDGTVTFQEFLGAAVRLHGYPQAKDTTAIFFWVLRHQMLSEKMDSQVSRIQEEQRKTNELIDKLVTVRARRNQQQNKRRLRG